MSTPSTPVNFSASRVKGGKPGAVTKLETSRPFKLPDGLRPLSGNSFLMIEGGGSLDHVTVNDDKVAVGTLKDGLRRADRRCKGRRHGLGRGRSTVASLRPKDNGPPRLPFQIVPVAIGDLGTKG